MGLSKVASWLSIAANVGLLVGMGLVVYEINQNTKLARMALVNEGNVASNQFWANLMGDSPADVIAMAAECPEMLTYSDFMSMDAYLGTGLSLLHRNYELAREGIFNDRDWQESVEGYASWYLGNPFGQAWWDIEGRYFFSQTFAEYVDLQLKQTSRDSYGYWRDLRLRLFGAESEGASGCLRSRPLEQN